VAIPASITEVCMDMSPAFIKGARESLPEGLGHLRQVPCHKDHR